MNEKQTSRRVAVTGSTGMIGSHLTAELVRSGYGDILLPVRNRGRIGNLKRTFERLDVAWPEDGALTAIETGITDPGVLTGILDGVDTVFNCAGVIMTGDLTEQQLIDNNVSIARSVAEASVAAGVRRIIHTSSIVVLAPDGNAETAVITENSRAHGDAHGSAYAHSKFLADCEIRKAALSGVEVTLLYPAVVLGEGDWSLSGSSALVPLIAGGIPFYTDGVMAYTDVRDVARACVAVDRSSGTAGEDFIVAGANLTYRQLISLGADTAGRRKPSIKVGTPLAMGAYGMIRLAAAIGLMKDRSITRGNIDSVLTGNRYSGEKLEKICGFRYTPAEETVGRVVKAYLTEKKPAARKKR